MTRSVRVVLGAALCVLGATPAAAAPQPVVALYPPEIVGDDSASERLRAAVASAVAARAVTLAPTEAVLRHIDAHGDCVERIDEERSRCLQRLARDVGADHALLITIAPKAAGKVQLSAQLASSSGTAVKSFGPYGHAYSRTPADIKAEVHDALEAFLPSIDLSPALSSAAPGASGTDPSPSTVAAVTPAAIAEPPPAVVAPAPGGTRRPLGIALMVTGAVGLGLGVYGVVDANAATSRWNELHQNGAPGPALDAELTSLRGRLDRNEAIAGAGLAAGALACAAGAYLFFTAPPSNSVPALAIRAGPGSATVEVRFP